MSSTLVQATECTAEPKVAAIKYTITNADVSALELIIKKEYSEKKLEFVSLKRTNWTREMEMSHISNWAKFVKFSNDFLVGLIGRNTECQSLMESLENVHSFTAIVEDEKKETECFQRIVMNKTSRDELDFHYSYIGKLRCVGI
jgi:hypothetical protein